MGFRYTDGLKWFDRAQLPTSVPGQEHVVMTEPDIRIPVLKRLAEQAMSSVEFRAAAREDLDLSLIHI